MVAYELSATSSSEDNADISCPHCLEDPYDFITNSEEVSSAGYYAIDLYLQQDNVPEDERTR